MLKVWCPKSATVLQKSIYRHPSNEHYNCNLPLPSHKPYHRYKHNDDRGTHSNKYGSGQMAKAYAYAPVERVRNANVWEMKCDVSIQCK